MARGGEERRSPRVRKEGLRLYAQPVWFCTQSHKKTQARTACAWLCRHHPPGWCTPGRRAQVRRSDWVKNKWSGKPRHSARARVTSLKPASHRPQDRKTTGQHPSPVHSACRRTRGCLSPTSSHTQDQGRHETVKAWGDVPTAAVPRTAPNQKNPRANRRGSEPVGTGVENTRRAAGSTPVQGRR